MVQLGDTVRVYFGKKRDRWWYGEVTRLLRTGSVDAQYWRGSWLNWHGQELRTTRVPARDVRVVTPVAWETYLPQDFLHLQITRDRGGTYSIDVSSGHAQKHLFALPTLEEAKQTSLAEAARTLKEQAGRVQQVDAWRHSSERYWDGETYQGEWWCGYLAEKFMQLRVYRTLERKYRLEVHAYRTLYRMGDQDSLEAAQALALRLAQGSLIQQARSIDAFEPSWRVVRAL